MDRAQAILPSEYFSWFDTVIFAVIASLLLMMLVWYLLLLRCYFLLFLGLFGKEAILYGKGLFFCLWTLYDASKTPT